MATHLSVSAAAQATAGTPLEVTVTALDANNNPVGSYSGTVRFSSTDGQAVLPANSTLANGKGTFSATLRTTGSTTITATDTVTASITGTSSSIEVGAGPATHFSVSAPTTAQSGTAFDLTVTALDVANNLAESYTGTVHFSSSDVQATLPGSTTLTDGTETSPAILQTAGSQSISATDTVTASITGTSSPVAVTAGPPSHFSVTAPATAQPGTAFNFTVTALDVANNVAKSYRGTVHFSSTDAQAALSANSTLTNGVGSFSATLQTPGTQTITATDTVTSITGFSSSIDVSAGPATHFSVTAPATAKPGTAFNFTVTARDAANNGAGSYAGTVHFSSTDARAVLPPDSTLTDGMGIFRATLSTTGNQTIAATDTVTASITGTSNAIDVFFRLQCQPKGAQCYAEPGHGCCAGLTCVAEGDREYCE